MTPASSAEGDAMLRAVLESPADDTPRLVYADWLQEHGEEERAAFIRAQCILASGYSNAKVASSERALLLNSAPRWVPGWEVITSARWKYCGSGIAVRFSRGFVSEITCTAADWLTHGDAILASHPVSRVMLPGFTTEITPLGPNRGWRLYYGPGAGTYFVMTSGLGTRAEMIERLMSGVQNLRAGFA